MSVSKFVHVRKRGETAKIKKKTRERRHERQKKTGSTGGCSEEKKYMDVPAVVYLLLFNYKPMYGIIIAFKNYSMRKGIMGSPWIGFANFQRLFSSY